MKQFTVNKTFLEGALKGMTIAEQTYVLFTVGKTYGGGWTGQRYKVVVVEPQHIPEPTNPEPLTIDMYFTYEDRGFRATPHNGSNVPRHQPIMASSVENT